MNRLARVSERALAVDPTPRAMRDDAARFARADGTPAHAVESVRRSGLEALSQLYGDPQ